MRLEVFCEDRLGLTRELLDLLVLRGIDLRGIDIDPIGRIYLNFAELEFASFSSLMAEIRRIAGVTDVRTVAWMPSERELWRSARCWWRCRNRCCLWIPKEKSNWLTRPAASCLARVRISCAAIRSRS